MKNLTLLILFTFALSGLGVAASAARPARDTAPQLNALVPAEDGWDEDKKKKKRKDGGEEAEEEYRVLGQAAGSGRGTLQG
jgi:hypothetical protein